MNAPYYDEGGVTIYHGDARALPLDVGSVACAVTSPPYNVGIQYDEHDDVMPWPKYREMAATATAEVRRVLLDGGRFWCNIVPTVTERPVLDERQSDIPRVSLLGLWLTAVEQAGMGVWDTVAWTTEGRGGATTWGSWETPSAPNLRGEWETVILSYKAQWPREVPGGMDGWRDKLGTWPALCSNVWRFATQHRAGHPAPFPIELAERCIRLSTWPGEVVLDPFMGSGTTLRAAKNLGRRAIGVEISERYCEIAARRLAQEVLDFA